MTPEDIKNQNRLRQERRPLSMDEYLEFLKFSQEFFRNSQATPPPKRPFTGKRFEL
jgi:hypothetical protein